LSEGRGGRVKIERDRESLPSGLASCCIFSRDAQLYLFLHLLLSPSRSSWPRGTVTGGYFSINEANKDSARDLDRRVAFGALQGSHLSDALKYTESDIVVSAAMRPAHVPSSAPSPHRTREEIKASLSVYHILFNESKQHVGKKKRINDDYPSVRSITATSGLPGKEEDREGGLSAGALCRSCRASLPLYSALRSR
ncbi:hypothetical protein L249_8234, partial [Ophiocordyceps polyrhachis-furcata BCC 54312]